MFNELFAVGRALRNLAVWCVRNPVSMLICLILSPVTVAIYLVRNGAWLLVFVFIAALIELVAEHYAPRWLFKLICTMLGILLLISIFRILTWPLLMHFGDRGGDAHGTARFAADGEVKHLLSDLSGSGLVIGREQKSGRLLRYDGPAHLLTMAPTRSGKGVGTVIPNLLCLDRSILCIDPKGENVQVTAQVRKRFGRVLVLDPFGVTAEPCASYNPLAALDAGSIDVAEDAAVIAEALVYDDPHAQGEAHWNEEAKALIAGMILHIVSCEEAEDRNLGRLREYLTLSSDHMLTLLSEMQSSKACNGLVARAANRQLGKSDREATGVLSSAQRHTHFLDSPRMASVLSRSDFSFGDLKDGVCTVYLVLPPDRMEAYARWLRLMVTQSLNAMARTPRTSQKPVLFLLDEFAALGHLAPVERAFGLMAGYGVQLWAILQDVHQLKATYARHAGTFLSNAGVLQVFGVNDHDSARLVSDLLGQATVVFSAMSRNLDSNDSGISWSDQHIGRPLLTPDEVRNLPETTQLLFLNGMRPVVARKIRYFEEREFVGR
ncbi:MAG: type IV secretory system conjugative DNA transfer family protein [Asticcacaulis sp.]|uniref:type IV secretory system conjugative DNA transfer family protein n=1 Tax=Asticcacaulis sp. TaxID=1872648 RepID=UPI003F7C8559